MRFKFKINPQYPQIITNRKSLTYIFFICVITISFVLINLFGYNSDYQKDFLNNFIYPALIVFLTGVAGLIFYEKFKIDLNMSYFKNSRVFENKLEKTQLLLNTISSIRYSIESVQDLVRNKDFSQIQMHQDNINDEIKTLRSVLFDNNIYFNNMTFKGTEELIEILGDYNELIKSSFSNLTFDSKIDYKKIDESINYLLHRLMIVSRILRKEVKDFLDL